MSTPLPPVVPGVRSLRGSRTSQAQEGPSDAFTESSCVGVVRRDCQSATPSLQSFLLNTTAPPPPPEVATIKSRSVTRPDPRKLEEACRKAGGLSQGETSEMWVSEESCQGLPHILSQASPLLARLYASVSVHVCIMNAMWWSEVKVGYLPQLVSTLLLN